MAESTHQSASTDPTFNLPSPNTFRDSRTALRAPCAPSDAQLAFILDELYVEVQVVALEWASHADGLRNQYTIIDERPVKRHKAHHVTPLACSPSQLVLPSPLQPGNALSVIKDNVSLVNAVDTAIILRRQPAPAHGDLEICTKRSFSQMQEDHSPPTARSAPTFDLVPAPPVFDLVHPRDTNTYPLPISTTLSASHADSITSRPSQLGGALIPSIATTTPQPLEAPLRGGRYPVFPPLSPHVPSSVPLNRTSFASFPLPTLPQAPLPSAGSSSPPNFNRVSSPPPSPSRRAHTDHSYPRGGEDVVKAEPDCKPASVTIAHLAKFPPTPLPTIAAMCPEERLKQRLLDARDRRASRCTPRKAPPSASSPSGASFTLQTNAIAKRGTTLTPPQKVLPPSAFPTADDEYCGNPISLDAHVMPPNDATPDDTHTTVRDLTREASGPPATACSVRVLKLDTPPWTPRTGLQPKPERGQQRRPPLSAASALDESSGHTPGHEQLSTSAHDPGPRSQSQNIASRPLPIRLVESTFSDVQATPPPHASPRQEELETVDVQLGNPVLSPCAASPPGVPVPSQPANLLVALSTAQLPVPTIPSTRRAGSSSTLSSPAHTSQHPLPLAHNENSPIQDRRPLSPLSSSTLAPHSTASESAFPRAHIHPPEPEPYAQRSTSPTAGPARSLSARTSALKARDASSPPCMTRGQLSQRSAPYPKEPRISPAQPRNVRALLARMSIPFAERVGRTIHAKKAAERQPMANSADVPSTTATGPDVDGRTLEERIAGKKRKRKPVEFRPLKQQRRKQENALG